MGKRQNSSYLKLEVEGENSNLDHLFLKSSLSDQVLVKMRPHINSELVSEMCRHFWPANSTLFSVYSLGVSHPGYYRICILQNYAVMYLNLECLLHFFAKSMSKPRLHNRQYRRLYYCKLAPLRIHSVESSHFSRINYPCKVEVTRGP